MEESDTSVSLSSLLCQEDEDCFNEKLGEHEEHKYTNLDPFFVLENEDEYIEELVQREACLGLEGYVNFDGCSTIGQSWLKCARLDAIQWILNVCFSPPLIYMCVCAVFCFGILVEFLRVSLF